MFSSIMFIKLNFYAIFLLQICCIAIINAGLVHKVTQPTTQVEKIKTAQSGITTCSIKSKLCHAGGRVLEAVGMEDTVPKLYQKSRENQVKMKGHVEDLRAATKKKDTSPNLGGAKSQEELDIVFYSGSDTLNKHDTKVANAENARLVRQENRQKRRAATQRQ